MFGLVGPDGAGKTTSIRVLLGLLTLDGGTARVLGHDPVTESALVKPEVGYLSQRFTLYGDLTVKENIEFFGEVHGVKDIAPRRDRLLGFTRLDRFQSRRADRVSGGMQKKLALACTLIHTPKVLFLDEPTTGVDPISRREFWELLSELLLEGLSVLLTTPYLDEAERCSRVALVRAGHTLACDTPAALRAEPGAPGGGGGLRAGPPRPGPPRGRARAGRRGAALRRPPPPLPHARRRRPRRPGHRLPGVKVTSVRQLDPSLEDVFIRRVEEAERAEAG